MYHRRTLWRGVHRSYCSPIVRIEDNGGKGEREWAPTWPKRWGRDWLGKGALAALVKALRGARSVMQREASQQRLVTLLNRAYLRSSVAELCNMAAQTARAGH